MEHFSTERLIARDWTVADAEEAFGIYGRDEVARWLGAPPHRAAASVAEMRQRLERIIERNAAQPAFGLWALELRDSGLVVGAVLLLPLPSAHAGRGAVADGVAGRNGDDELEIGWHLNPGHWGRGYATEAGQGVIDLALRVQGRSEVLAVVYPDNLRSLAVCRRLGMTHRGQTDRYYGVTLELFSIRADTAAGR